MLYKTEKNEDGSHKNVIVRNNKNKMFRCSCGCNVFGKVVNKEIFVCNSCGVAYEEVEEV